MFVIYFYLLKPYTLNPISKDILVFFLLLVSTQEENRSKTNLTHIFIRIQFESILQRDNHLCFCVCDQKSQKKTPINQIICMSFISITRVLLVSVLLTLVSGILCRHLFNASSIFACMAYRGTSFWSICNKSVYLSNVLYYLSLI